MNIAAFEVEPTKQAAWDQLCWDHLVTCVPQAKNRFNAAEVADAEIVSTFIDSNVIVTPHIAYDTTEAVRRIVDRKIADIQDFANGGPQNVVSS